MKSRSIACAVLFLSAALFPCAFAGDAALQKADAVYLDVLDEYTLFEDGSTLHRHEHRVKLLTHYAFNRLLGESFLVHDPRFQELKINRAVTVMADGKEVPCTPNAINELLPGFCRNAPPYNYLRETVITHLGLEVGAVIHLDHEVRSKPGFFPYLMGEELFSSVHPVEKKTVVVKVPKNVELNHGMLNSGGIEPVIAKLDGFTSYTWELSAMPATLPEPMARSPADYKPLLVFSTCSSWTDAARSLNRRFTAAAWLDEECEKKLKEVLSEKTGSLERVFAINSFVNGGVALADVQPEHTGYSVLRAEDVFQHSVGSRLDKACLLVVMLRSAGFFAEPVLVSRHREVARDVPSWLQFSECRVLCSLRKKLSEPLLYEEPLLLSTNRIVSGTKNDRLAGRTLFRPSLLNNQLLPVEAQGHAKNKVRAELSLALDKSKHTLSGGLHVEVEGSLNENVELARGFEGWAGRCFKKLLSGADLSETGIVLLGEKRSILKARARSSSPLKKEGDFFVYEAPGCPGGLMEMNVPVALYTRTTPLEMPRGVSEDLSVAIDLPESISVAELPPPMEFSSPAGSMLSRAWEDQGVLHIRRALSVKRCIPPDEYEAFRKLVIEWESPDTRRIVLVAAKQE